MLSRTVHDTDVFMHMFFSIPFIIFALLVMFPPTNSRKSDQGSHIRLFSPLPTTVYMPCIFIARQDKYSALSSLVDSRPIVRTQALVGTLDS